MKDFENQNSRIPQDYFFEGSEKLMEIWFKADHHDSDLRAIPR